MPYRINAITGELNLTNSSDGSSPASCKVQTDSGAAVLSNISGGNNIATSGSSSTVTISLDSDITANSFTTVDPHQNLTISKGDIRANGTDPNVPISILAKGSSPVILGPSVSIDTLHIDGNSISSTNTNGGIVLEPNGSGSVQIPYGTPNSLVYFGESGSLTNLGPLNDGQLVIGTSDNPPTVASLTAGKNITITQGSGSITIASTAAADDKVTGPSSAIDSNLCAFDDTTGKLIKDSGVSSSCFIQIKNNLSDLKDKEEARSNLGLKIGEDIQSWSNQLDSLSSMRNGLVARISIDKFISRELRSSSFGITIKNGDGIKGSPTFYLGKDLESIGKLIGVGIATRTEKGQWSTRFLKAGPGISITNKDGVKGDPVISSKSGMVLIQSQTAKNSPSIIFSSGLVYKNYMLLMSGVMCTDNYCSLRMLMSQDKGSSYLTTGYETCARTTATALGPSEAVPCLRNSDSLSLSGHLLNGSIYKLERSTPVQKGPVSNYSGSIHIFNVGAPDPFMIRGQCLYNSVWDQWYQGDISGCGGTGANAFLIQMSSGNIKSGTFSLFGFNEEQL